MYPNAAAIRVIRHEHLIRHNPNTQIPTVSQILRSFSHDIARVAGSAYLFAGAYRDQQDLIAFEHIEADTCEEIG